MELDNGAGKEKWNLVFPWLDNFEQWMCEHKGTTCVISKYTQCLQVQCTWESIEGRQQSKLLQGTQLSAVHVITRALHTCPAMALYLKRVDIFIKQKCAGILVGETCADEVKCFYVIATDMNLMLRSSNSLNECTCTGKIGQSPLHWTVFLWLSGWDWMKHPLLHTDVSLMLRNSLDNTVESGVLGALGY